ncbi:hypothetical protein FGG08_004935 [Glutinoglossum americanum]|uniref:Uncharacterized protein n=1 Tax=Glutinoglossum americanum TaxID=1670608 RepID=A0A9P8L1Z1_9PEZI|nr:hypothetical protein FGG08_004935 [Glutinoglossum americanum]
MAPDIYSDIAQVCFPAQGHIVTRLTMVWLQSKQLELIYVQCARKNDILFQEEDARRLRLRVLLLEDENSDLQDQLAQEEDRIDLLENEKEELQERVTEALEGLKLAQTEVRIKGRELDNIKAELSSLNSVSTSSSKLLAEKLALAHELSTLKPELEHLRSQAASYQSLISEKLSLQRQLSTIQVELETEKRAAQRVLTKGGKENEQDLKLQAQLDSLRQELSKEKRGRERAEREAKKGSDDWESKKAVLESKLEATKGKLRAAKDQLKEKETELQQAQAAAARAASTQVQNTTTASKNPRKRPVAPSSVQDTIGTPGDGAAKGRRAAKRNAGTAALPGDKSTFSMTPFLNRTASIAPESPPRQQEEEGKEGEEEDEEEEGNAAKERGGDGREGTVAQESDGPDEDNSPSKAPKMRAAKGTSKKKTNPASGNPLTATNAGKSNVLGKRSAAAPVLEKVVEENDENAPPGKEATATKPAKKATVLFSSIMDVPEPKKKKRKILGGGPGKTLFDDDDAERAKPGKSLFGGAKGFAGLSKGGLGGSKGKAMVGGFGEISPLKKDKKSAR